MNTLKKGAVKLDGGQDSPPMSIHHKQIPGGDSSPVPMSFHRKQNSGGDLRPFLVRADEKLKNA